MIKSVQSVTITVSGTSGSASLSGITTIGNCVPFLSYYGDTVGDIQWDWHLEAVITGSPDTITVYRGASTLGTLYVRAWVVEFDGDEFAVTSGTLDIPDASNTAAPSITSKTNTFGVYTWQYTTTTTDDWEEGVVRFTIDTDGAPGQLTGIRDTSTGGVEGTYYLVEHTGAGVGLEVRHSTFTIANDGLSSTGSASITAVTLNRAFVYSTWYSTNADDDLADACVETWCSSTTQVDAQRDNTATETVYIATQVVYLDSDAENLVQHGTFTWTDASNTTAQATLGTAIDTTDSIGICSPCITGMRSSDIGGNFEGGFVRTHFSDTTHLDGTRGSTSGSGQSRVSAISFKQAGGAPATTLLDIERATMRGSNRGVMRGV